MENWVGCHYALWENTIRYWCKLLNMSDNSLQKITYLMLKNDAENNITYDSANWASQIKSILETHGLGDTWYSRNADSVPMSLIKQKVFNMFHQSWYTEINNSPRLSCYSRLKHSFIQEKHLSFISDKKYRMALCKFRISAHNLAIERGRYEIIPRDDRKCKFCNLNVVESEYHFLLVYPLYGDLRRKYFSSYFCQWPSLIKFENLMSSQSKRVQINIAKFIYAAENRLIWYTVDSCYLDLAYLE